LAALVVALTLGLALVRPYVRDLTRHGQDRELWDVSLPALDFGIDVSVAKPGQRGYLSVWLFWHGADDIVPLVDIPGAPALPPAAPSHPPVQRRLYTFHSRPP
jgi:hypothetical protein